VNSDVTIRVMRFRFDSPLKIAISIRFDFFTTPNYNRAATVLLYAFGLFLMVTSYQLYGAFKIIEIEIPTRLTTNYNSHQCTIKTPPAFPIIAFK
jgi:hypothetical protein